MLAERWLEVGTWSALAQKMRIYLKAPNCTWLRVRRMEELNENFGRKPACLKFLQNFVVNPSNQQSELRVATKGL